jgi:UDP-N-acetylmuramyl pentapeptide synthase
MKINIDEPNRYALIILCLAIVFGIRYCYKTYFLSERERAIIDAKVEISCYISGTNIQVNNDSDVLRVYYIETQNIAKKYGFSSVDKDGGLNWTLAQIHPDNLSKFNFITNKIDQRILESCGK